MGHNAALLYANHRPIATSKLIHLPLIVHPNVLLKTVLIAFTVMNVHKRNYFLLLLIAAIHSNFF